MIHKPVLLALSFCLLAPVARADKKEEFIVRVRFNHDAIVYLNRGVALAEKGDLRGARQNYDAAIKDDPKIWPAYLNRAVILAGEGKWEAALQDCNQAMKLRPGFFRTSIVRANINANLGHDRASLADLDLVVSLHADDETDAYALSQRALLRALSRDPAVHNPKAALADGREACRLNHWRKASYIDALAVASAAAGDREAAAGYEERAIKSGKLTDDELKRAHERLAQYQGKDKSKR